MAAARDDHPQAARQATMAKGLGLHIDGYFTQPPRALRLRLRQGRADQGVRRRDGHARRPARSTRRSTSRSSSEARAAIAEQARRHRPVVGDRDDRPQATATSWRWPPRPSYGKSKFNLAAQGHRQPGSSFKVMALMTALREGVEPGHDALHLEVADAHRRPAVRRAVRRSRPTAARAPAASRCTRRRCSPTTRSTSSSPPTSARTRSRRPRGRPGHHVQAQRLLRRDARRPRATASRRWRWPTPTRRSPTAATATGRRRSRKVDVPGRARVRAAGALARQAHEGVLGRRHLRGDEDPRGQHARRHRHARADRLPGRPARRARPTSNTDAWFVGFTPRLSTAVWVGYPERPHVDERPLPRRATSTAAPSRRRSGAPT